jgi:hypothetical protein
MIDQKYQENKDYKNGKNHYQNNLIIMIYLKLDKKYKKVID